MKKYLLLGFLAVFTTVYLQAQDDTGGFAYGVKGGLSMGTQKWNNSERDILFAYHGLAFIESLPADNKFSVFAQTGYHVRGSAIRSRAFTWVDPNTGSDRQIRAQTRKYEFYNISLGLGAKQRFELRPTTYAYYMLGIRGEYTLGTNLCDYKTLREEGFRNDCSYDAFDDFTRKWNYGMILGGGLEFELAERMGVLVELTVNPDVSQQYQQPDNVPTLVNNNGSGTTTFNTLSEQLVRNTSIELSIGIRLLRIVEYID